MIIQGYWHHKMCLLLELYTIHEAVSARQLNLNLFRFLHVIPNLWQM